MARTTTFLELNQTFSQITESSDEFVLQNIGSHPIVIIFSESQPSEASNGIILIPFDVVTHNILGIGVIWARSTNGVGFIAKTIG